MTMEVYYLLFKLNQALFKRYLLIITTYGMLKKEIKTLAYEVKEFTKDDNYFYFEGYASTPDKDLGNDIIEKGAFLKSLQNNPEVLLLWQHNMSKPIGLSIELREDEKGLYIKGRLSIRTTLGKDASILLEDRVIKEMSIGYYAKETDMQDGIRYIKEVELIEVSLVTRAMNPKARIKSFNEIEFKGLKDIEAFLKELEWEGESISNSISKTLISKVKEFSNQRDAEEKKALREVEEKANALTALTSLKELTNFINQNNK